eukprot:351634-Chlamydomonas_euryale.AAC.5
MAFLLPDPFPFLHVMVAEVGNSCVQQMPRPRTCSRIDATQRSRGSQQPSKGPWPFRFFQGLTSLWESRASAQPAA